MAEPDPQINPAELAYLIQEGKARQPRVAVLLVRLYAPRVHRLAGGLVGADHPGSELALALTEQAFASAVAEAETLEQFDTIPAWLFAALLDLAQPILRRRARPKSADAAPGGLLPLPGKLRLPALLHYAHHLPPAEIAAALRLKPEQAARRLGQARQKLWQAARASRPPRLHVRRTMFAILDGLAEPDAGFAAHLEICDACRAGWADLQEFEQTLKSELARAATPPLDESQLQGITARLLEGESVPPEREPRLGTREFAWLASAMAGFFIITWFLNPYWTPASPSPPAPTASIAPEPLTEGGVDREASLAAAASAPPESAVWGEVRREELEFVPTAGSLSFSPDGELAAYASRNLLVLWDLDAGGGQKAEEVKGNWITRTAFSRRGAYLATADRDGKVEVRPLAHAGRLFRLGDFPAPLLGLAWSPVRDVLAIGAPDGVTIWGREDDRFVRLAQLGGLPVTALAWSPAGTRLATADGTGVISIWNTQTWQRLLTFKAHDMAVTGLSFAPGGAQLGSVSADGTAGVYEFTTTEPDSLAGTQAYAIGRAGGAAPEFLVFAPLTNLAALGWEDGSLSMINAGSGLSSELALPVDPDRVVAAAYFVGERFVTVGVDRQVRWYRLSFINVANAIPPRHFVRAESNFIQAESEPVRVEASGLPVYHTLAEVQAEAAFPVAEPGFISNRYAYVNGSYNTQTGTAITIYQYRADGGISTSLVLQQTPRPLDEAEPAIQDLIGAAASVTPIQIGKAAGELVSGTWVPRAEDNPNLSDLFNAAEPVPLWYRWTPGSYLRLRWEQDGYRFQLSMWASSDIASAQMGLNEMLIFAREVVGEETQQKYIAHEVNGGETCTAIAARYGTTIGALASLNTLDADCTIFIGQVLQIPLPPPSELINEIDLNCDGIPERLLVIPDPFLENGTVANFGVSLEAIPAGLTTANGTHVPVWGTTIADLDADFFGLPLIIRPPGMCRAFFAVTAFSRQPELGGMRIYTWNGAAVTLLLDTAGFLVGDPGFNPAYPGEFTLTTQRITYDPEIAACIQKTTIHIWQGGAFHFLAEETVSGLECFPGAP
jgi:DNA-directed RNA polymerase specialized sigma24 family protein/LysM repeat protein